MATPPKCRLMAQGTQLLPVALALFFFFFFFCFLGPYLQHLEVPRPGVESELQLLAYSHTTATAMQDPSNAGFKSANYTRAHGNARSLTH